MQNTQKPAERKVPSVVKIGKGELKKHLEGIVRSSVDETLNSLLEAEADELCQARHYKAGYTTNISGKYFILCWKQCP